MNQLFLYSAILGSINGLSAQTPGVPVVAERHGDNVQRVAAAERLIEEGVLLDDKTARRQLDRKSTKLSLAEPATRALTGSELFMKAREAHVQVGWFYKCTRCDRWHFNLAGGYAITADGAVATCFHVVEPNETLKEGFMIAVTTDGDVLPVSEVLAANEFTDTCIVRVVTTTPFKPLPLQTEVHPGDDVWCFSDPAGREGYFSKGIVNRVFQHFHGEEAPIRINVSTDWAPGSSGSAVLDGRGNAIGHVTTIDAHGDRSNGGSSTKDPRTLIVFHTAVRAMDVMALIDESD